MKNLVSLLLIMFSPAVFAGAETAVSTQMAENSHSASADTLKPAAEIQACLDQITLSKQKPPSNTPQVYTYHKVDDPAELPSNDSSCSETITTMDEIRLGLQRQLTDCQRRINDVNRRKTCAALRTMTLGCRVVSEKDFCLGTVNMMINLAKGENDFQNFMAKTKTAFDWYQDDGRQTAQKGFPVGSMKFTGYYVPPPYAATHVNSNPDPTTSFYQAPKGLVNLSTTLDPKSCQPVAADCGTDRVTGLPHKVCIDNHNGTYSLPPGRAQINAGAMAGQEIGQVASPQLIADADLEGSAALQFGSAPPTALNYVSDNGMHGFYPRVIMSCAGATAAELKAGWNAFLAAHAARKIELLNYNDNVIFWSPSAPAGVDGIPLTRGVSLATNIAEVPTGAVTMYNTRRPGKNSKACMQRTSMGISQDKGGAINDNHIDVYTGEGKIVTDPTTNKPHDQAYDDAQISDPGSLFVAVPPGAGQPIPNCRQ